MTKYLWICIWINVKIFLPFSLDVNFIMIKYFNPNTPSIPAFSDRLFSPPFVHNIYILIIISINQCVHCSTRYHDQNNVQTIDIHWYLYINTQHLQNNSFKLSYKYKFSFCMFQCSKIYVLVCMWVFIKYTHVSVTFLHIKKFYSCSQIWWL